MALTKDFRDTIRDRAQRDPKFRRALLEEAVAAMIADDMETGRSLMRNYINATVGFDQLAVTIEKKKSSLMRMFGPRGNPSANNIFHIIATLQKQEGVSLTVHAA
jgi:DNA-binding phage protein